jgi:hypothetical protein
MKARLCDLHVRRPALRTSLPRWSQRQRAVRHNGNSKVRVVGSQYLAPRSVSSRHLATHWGTPLQQ